MQQAQSQARPERPDTVREMFGRIAPGYDRLNHLLSANIDRRWRDRCVARFLEHHPSTGPAPALLDLCCGTGDLALAFDRALAPLGGRVTGADFCAPMLRLAREKGAGSRLAWVQADALDLPWPADRYHGATMAFGLRNLADPLCGLAEMRRVLRPGGLALVLEFSLPSNPLLRPLYRLYLGRLLPALGNRLSRSDAYGYLARTVRDFAQPPEVLGWFEAAGFAEARAEPLSAGICQLYTGVKP